MKENLPSGETIRRLFFAWEVEAPWQEAYLASGLPSGKIILEDHRHLTVAFLGNADFKKLLTLLPSLPTPFFSLGLAGIFDKFLFLPSHHPHVVAYHAKWLDLSEDFLTYRKTLISWLRLHQYSVKEHDEFLPHVTICRRPFNLIEWKKSFNPLPFISYKLHLYESLGHSQYHPVWTYSLLPPFKEIEHTADVAFLIYGQSFNQLYIHALTALSFLFPAILPFFNLGIDCKTLDEIVMHLNDAIAKADGEIGCSFKAVSFHGKLNHNNSLLNWEMIIDV